MLAPNKVLIAVTVPDRVTLAVLLEPSVTPVPGTTLIVPFVTAKVTVTLPPASTSLIDKPLITLAVSSAVVCAPGTVFNGASLTDVTVILTVSLSVSAPSLVVMVSVLVPLKFAVGV